MPLPEDKMELEGVDLSEGMLFYGSPKKLVELALLASRCIEEVERSDNVRLIVLETWLFIDFCIRQILISGLDLNEINVDCCDLRIHLLPRSFRGCIHLIVRLRDVHSALPRDPSDMEVRLPGLYLLFIKKEFPKLFTKLLEVEQQYYRRYAPELVKTGPFGLPKYKTLAIYTSKPEVQVEYSNISVGWLNAVVQIDKEWIKAANRLNEARNFAAHSYDASAILSRMGYSGPNSVSHLKDECIELLKKLIGISKSIESEGDRNDGGAELTKS
jgi:hypothetical protein